MIEPIIMNRDFERIAQIDDYISLIWTARYYEPGDFEIVVPVTEEYNEYLVKGNYLIRDDDEHVGIIEDITKETDEEQAERMIVTGRFAESILARRIIAEQTQLSGTISAGVASLIVDSIIDPAIPERKISNFEIAASGYTDRLDAQYTGKNLLEVIEDICRTNHTGFVVTLTEENKFCFRLFKGSDRSYAQEENPFVIFSAEYDNLLSSKYESVSSSMVTSVLVAGEGEGTERKTLWVDTEGAEGIDRYEVYKDQRNLSTNNGEISDEEYADQMAEEGMESITRITTAFEGKVYFDNIEYRKDVYIGDVVVIENKEWNVSINSRLIEVIESVNEAGEYEVIPTFGT